MDGLREELKVNAIADRVHETDSTSLRKRSESSWASMGAAGDGHHQALRAVANRWVGILHGCLRYHSSYDETVAWPELATTQPANELAA